MKTKFQIIETPDYILAVSYEEITGFENNILVFKGGRLWLWENTMALRSNNKPNKIIAYQPKNNAPELDLPLLPEMVVEDDDMEKAYKSNKPKESDNPTKGELAFSDGYYYGFEDGYKAATKTFSEDDLRKAIDLSRETLEYNEQHGWYNTMSEDEIIQFLKQPNPKCFIAEMEVKKFSSIHELKTTTNSQGNIQLVGTYE